MKCQIVLGVDHLERFVGSWRFCSMCGRSEWLCVIDSTSLTVHGELNHMLVTLCHMFTLVDQLSWVTMGGGCYRVVLEHG